jgi:predicted esterase
MRDDMHDHHRILRQGSPVGEARVAAVLVHGRGGSAEDILSLASEFRAEGVAYIAPQAIGHSWYPYSFLAPLTQNEPGLSSGLRLLASIVDDLNAQGLSSDRIALLGFSQGACLALEFAARNARKYTFVAAFSGALIGPDGTPRNYAGSFGGTPCSWDVATSTRISRCSGFTNLQRCFIVWVAPSMSASTLAWATRSIVTS